MERIDAAMVNEMNEMLGVLWGDVWWGTWKSWPAFIYIPQCPKDNGRKRAWWSSGKRARFGKRRRP